MSNITPDLALYVDNSGTPSYHIDVTLPTGSGFEISEHGEVPGSASPENQIHVNVHLVDNNGGEETIQIDLGELPIDSIDGEVHINLLDASTQSTGGGIIKTEEATEDSKPIPTS